MFLDLVQEVRIGELLKGDGDKRYEASGVCEKDGFLHIVFDDDPHLLRIRADLSYAGEKPVLLDLKGTGSGYEDITYQSSAGCWYCLIEAAETKSGVSMPRVDAFDESFAFIRSYWLDYPLKAGNKGFEGLATLRSGGNEYLLGLCEGNKCKSGRAGKKPGKGRIQVFKRDGETWVTYRTSNSGIPGNAVTRILQDPAGQLWFGMAYSTEPGGFIAAFNGETWRSYSPQNSGYSGGEPSALVFDAENRLWIGTQVDGVTIYQPQVEK